MSPEEPPRNPAMEILIGLFMLVGGGIIAGVVLLATSALKREEERAQAGGGPEPRRDSVAASLLYHVILAGGGGREDALRRIRGDAGLGAPVTQGIDVASWAESFARASSMEQRSELLETAVRLIATPGRAIPLRQYAALLDLSFGLGFQTDALARLRAAYGFDYIDHAKDGRPRDGGREGIGAIGRAPSQPVAELFEVLGIPAGSTRQQVSAAYRRLVAQHHPDRFHGASREQEEAAAGRFIEITRAYEELIGTFRD